MVMLMEIHDSLMTELSKRVDGQTDIMDIHLSKNRLVVVKFRVK